MLKRSAAAILAVALLAGPALAEPKHHRPERASEERDLGSVFIDAAARAIIRDYAQSHPGMIGGDNLPPGIRKKLARGKPLPPGIAKKMPGGLHAQLPMRPGYDYRRVGADVLLVEVATGVIVDVVKDILR
jgi:hypothetical protein